MITKDTAKRIGSRHAAWCVTAGVVIAQLIMMSFTLREGIVHAFLWFLDAGYLPHMLIGIAIMYCCGYFYGGKAGVAIIVRRWHWLPVGLACGLLTLLSAAALAGIAGFFTEGLRHDDTVEAAYNYLGKPFLLITVFGFIPAIIVGVILGFTIHRAARGLERGA